MKWTHRRASSPFADTESIRWTLNEQWLMDGCLEVELWVTVHGRSKVSSTVWAGATLTGEQVDNDTVVQVMLSEIKQHVEDGRYNEAKDLLDLLGTL